MLGASVFNEQQSWEGRVTSKSEGGRRARGSSAVFEELREDILSLRIEPGTPFDEVVLSKRFGLSRTPVREALLMLSHEDLVKVLPGRSAIVAPLTMSNSPQYMDALALHIRAISRLAAEMRSDADIERIGAAQKDYAKAERAGDVDYIVATYLAFHHAIAAASDNEFLSKFYRLSLDYGRRMMRLHYYPARSHEEMEECIGQSEALADAIEKRDGDRSEEVALRIILDQLAIIQRSLAPRTRVGLNLRAVGTHLE